MGPYRQAPEDRFYIVPENESRVRLHQAQELEGSAISAAVLDPINTVLLRHDHHYDYLDPAGPGDLS